MNLKAVLFISSLLCAAQLGGSQQECATKDDVHTIVNNAIRDFAFEIQRSLRAQQTLMQRMQAAIQGFVSETEEETRDVVRELLSEKPSKDEMETAVDDMLETVTQKLALAHNGTEEHVTQELRELQHSHQITFTEVLKSCLEDFLQQCHEETTTIVSPTTSSSTTAVVTTAEAVSAQCGGPGWRRVVSLDMTDSSQTCPAGLSLTGYSKRTCGRSLSGDRACSSTTFSVGGAPYRRVCGRAKGYQWYHAYAFFRPSNSLNNYYVHGLSLTHGAPGSREHIWTFAVGLQIDDPGNAHTRCPCDRGATNPAPSFIRNDYYCESGASFFQVPNLHPFPLWDGQDCSTGSTCCQHPDLPWFYKDLPASTTDDIELRLCCFNRASLSNIALEQLELYVH